LCIEYCENFSESGYRKIGQSIVTSNTNQSQSHDNNDNGNGEVIDQNQSHNNNNNGHGEVIGKIIKIILFLNHIKIGIKIRLIIYVLIKGSVENQEIIDLTADDSDLVAESHLENLIRLDIQAESYAIDNHSKGRKKSKRRTRAVDNATQSVDHQFIEVTPEEILSQNRNQVLGPNVTTRSQSKSKRNSRSSPKRTNSKRRNN
jgi:hypothetical protein